MSMAMILYISINTLTETDEMIEQNQMLQQAKIDNLKKRLEYYDVFIKIDSLLKEHF